MIRRLFLWRVTLLFLDAVIIIANIAWFSFREHSEFDDFEIELTSHSLKSDDETEFPTFNTHRENWSFHGQPLKSLLPYLIDSDPEGIGPDGIGKYFAFRLISGEQARVLRRAFASVASQGICQVAIFDAASREGAFEQSPVYRIRKVRSDDGRIIECKQRI